MQRNVICIPSFNVSFDLYFILRAQAATSVLQGVIIIIIIIIIINIRTQAARAIVIAWPLIIIISNFESIFEGLNMLENTHQKCGTL